MLQEAQAESTQITGNLKNTAKEATTLLQAISNKLLAIEQYITTFDDDYLKVYDIRDFEATASLAALDKLEHDSHQLKILENIKFYNATLDSTLKSAIENSVTNGESLLEDYESVLALKRVGFNAEQAALHLQANVWQSMDILAAGIERKLADTTMAVISVGIGAIVVGILIAFIVAISITRPIKRMVKAMQNIAEGEGDLTQKLEVNGRDEVALLAAGFNQFSESIRLIVQGVLESTVKLTSAADELKQHSNNAHNNIHVQGKETENVDTAVNNMNSTAHEIAGNTITATEAAQVAETAANDSLEKMSDTVISINELASAVEEPHIL
jgi:methyl-accepting chemotaxis protein